MGDVLIDVARRTTEGAVVILNKTRGQPSHVLEQSGAGWRYGERSCFTVGCGHVAHAGWRWRFVTEDERRTICRLFGK